MKKKSQKYNMSSTSKSAATGTTGPTNNPVDLTARYQWSEATGCHKATFHTC